MNQNAPLRSVRSMGRESNITHASWISVWLIWSDQLVDLKMKGRMGSVAYNLENGVVQASSTLKSNWIVTHRPTRTLPFKCWIHLSLIGKPRAWFPFFFFFSIYENSNEIYIYIYICSPKWWEFEYTDQLILGSKTVSMGRSCSPETITR